jgi:hypothetical protein
VDNSSIRNLAWTVLSRSAAVGGLVVLPATASAQTTIPELQTIVRLNTGWGSDVFGVSVNRPIVNPAGCSTPDGYNSESPHLGHRTHYAALLMAFATGRQVQITVSNTACVHGRPAIMGVSVH